MISQEILDQLYFFVPRFAVALVAGTLLGIERDIHSGNITAGLKTVSFVTVGSCLFTSLSIWMSLHDENIDPTRIIGQIITGIGFLGAGAIFKTRESVKGLTTASVIWCSCALGCLAGTGMYMICVIFTVFCMIGLIVLRKLENIIEKKISSNKNTE